MKLRNLLVVAAVFAIPVIPMSEAVAADKFVFTAIPDQDESALRKRFDKVAKYLSSTLSMKVEYVPVKSYAAAVTAFLTTRYSLRGLVACREFARGVLWRDQRRLHKVRPIQISKLILLPMPAPDLPCRKSFKANRWKDLTFGRRVRRPGV